MSFLPSPPETGHSLTAASPDQISSSDTLKDRQLELQHNRVSSLILPHLLYSSHTSDPQVHFNIVTEILTLFLHDGLLEILCNTLDIKNVYNT